MLWLVPHTPAPSAPAQHSPFGVLHHTHAQLSLLGLPAHLCAPSETPGPHVRRGHVWLEVGASPAERALVQLASRYAPPDLALASCLQHLWQQLVGPCRLHYAAWPQRSRLPVQVPALRLLLPPLGRNAQQAAAALALAQATQPFLTDVGDAPSVFRFLYVSPGEERGTL